jgi:hypothetical protein
MLLMVSCDSKHAGGSRHEDKVEFTTSSRTASIQSLYSLVVISSLSQFKNDGEPTRHCQTPCLSATGILIFLDFDHLSELDLRRHLA